MPGDDRDIETKLNEFFLENWISKDSIVNVHMVNSSLEFVAFYVFYDDADK